MRYFSLASDYDGTLALHGRVDTDAIAALQRLRDSGRKLLLVTGRELEELLQIFPEIELCHCVVAENGALLYYPATQEFKLLAPAPPDNFVAELRRRGIDRISVGHAIVATWRPFETIVLEAIRDLGLDLQVIFNKDAVMVLPAGVNKATGLAAALNELGLSPHNVVGIGDAENDLAFLNACECAVAVANALPAVKERADLVTAGDHSAGVIDVIDRLVTADLQGLESVAVRHRLVLGRQGDREADLDPYGSNLLIAGSSGSGKSTLAVGLLERIAAAGYQTCIIDPEGDYSILEGSVSLGTPQDPPNADEVLTLLENPRQNLVVNMVGVRFEDRPEFLVGLLTRLHDLRSRTGRPHWLLIDEAHHVLPAAREAESDKLSQLLSQTILITVEPDSVLPAALSGVGTVIAVGETPASVLQQFAQLKKLEAPGLVALQHPLASGETWVWRPETQRDPFLMQVVPGRTERRRHRRKYAEGDLGEDRSFYFRGPEDKLNLRAQNLILFMQIADGVDDDTWLHHLRLGGYSDWLRGAIKDEELAAEAAQIEQDSGLSAAESRAKLRAAIESRYTLPAERGEV